MPRSGDLRARTARHGRTVHRVARAASAADRRAAPGEEPAPRTGSDPDRDNPGCGKHPLDPPRPQIRTPRDREILSQKLKLRKKKCQNHGRYSQLLLINIDKHHFQTVSTGLSTIRRRRHATSPPRIRRDSAFRLRRIRGRRPGLGIVGMPKSGALCILRVPRRAGCCTARIVGFVPARRWSITAASTRRCVHARLPDWPGDACRGAARKGTP